MYDQHQQQRQAGEKSGLVRAASSRLAHLLGSDTDTLLADLSGGTIGGVPLDATTVQTILERATTSALETAIRSNAAMREIEFRHKCRLEVEEQRHQNRLLKRSHSPSISDPDNLSISDLMAREGTQEEAISASGAIQSTLTRPPANLTFGEWYETLGQKQKRAVISWFDSEIDLNSAAEMDARYVFDNMSNDQKS
ncbi:hypothetical protein [Aeromonas media]|uniref:hypothetical protein n=1 Tax=Aeromonas media TaxID=651 RepID=UPI003D23168C